MDTFSILHPLPIDRWEEYRDLRLEAVRTEPYAFLDTEEETQHRSREEWLQWIKNAYFVESGGRLIAMASLVRSTKEKQKHIANFYGVYVRPEYRGKGVGRMLLTALLQKARDMGGVRKILLGVMVTQTAAISLYQSLGFETIGVTRDEVCVDGKFYDDVLMELFLS